jgi:hypothetical protein
LSHENPEGIFQIFIQARGSVEVRGDVCACGNPLFSDAGYFCNFANDQIKARPWTH